MSLRRTGINNQSEALMENTRHDPEYPSREELNTQLAQLRSSLEGAYETLDSISPSTDPEVTSKVADMVDVINGLHECELELMDLLASPAPSRVSDQPVDKNSDKLCDGQLGTGGGGGDNDLHSEAAASQEDLSLYGAYAVSSSRPIRTSNELSKVDKSSDRLDSTESYSHIPTQHRLDYIKRLEEIQKVNERLVDRCRRLGLVLSQGFALDKNISTKMKEVKDIVATKEQAQRKILELKSLIQQVTEEKLDTEISLSKIENDESYGRPFRYESRITPRGVPSESPHDDHHVPRGAEEENLIKKPRSFLGIVDSAEQTTAPDYAQFLRGLRQPFSREHGERESAFVPIHNAAHMDPHRDRKNSLLNSEPSNGDCHNEVKVPRATANASLLRKVIEGGHPNPFPPNISQMDQHRPGRSSSARASMIPPPLGCNTMPTNVFRSNYSKSPPSMQSSSGIGSMNSRSMASLDNGRGDLPPYLSCNMPSRIASRIPEPEDNIAHRSFPERSNMSSNNLNKTYRQPTRSSSFYSELEYRPQEVFPTMGWDEDGLHNHSSPMRTRSPEFRRRMLSTIESQQITDELNRVLRCRNSEESLPLSQQNWWSSSTELGQADRHSYGSDHSNFLRGKSLMPERTAADCYTQIMQLHVGIQEITQQIRGLTVSVAANKTATRDALLQHRFDLHNVTRCIRDVSDMVSESMKRVEGQLGSQTRLIMDIETRLRRVEENQRTGNHKYESTREREWQVPARPDFMESHDLPFQYGHGGRDAISRERENGQSGSILNNQIPPGTRANNYWDNFRSYSRQNMLSKSNANVPQQFSHEASPAATDVSRHTYTSSDVLNNSQSAVSDLSSTESSRRNGNGKNLWATSGFYENMSTKKRNKDQKSQSSALTSSLSKSTGLGNISFTNSSSAAEHLGSSRDSQPEPDDSNALSSNRETAYSHLSPQISPFRRDTDSICSGPFSRLPDFEVPWPWPSLSSESAGRKSRETESNRDIQSTESGSGATVIDLRESRLDDNPNSHLSAPKADREKHMQNFKTRSSEALPNSDDSHANNQDLLDGVDERTTNWATNALEGVNNSVSTYRSPVVSPLLRPMTDNNENNALELVESLELRGSVSSPIADTPSTTVAMNIRCEESAITNEDSGGRNGSRSSESTSNNNM